MALDFNDGAGSFERLLSSLHPTDRDEAADEYERLRRKLIVFFHGRQCGPAANDLTDRAFSIFQRKLEQRPETLSDPPGPLLFGIAKHLVWEYKKKPLPLPLPSGLAQSESDWHQGEQRLECLEHCLRLLPEDQRLLIQEYYQETGRAGIERRRKLAEQLGVSMGSLGVRAHRIRRSLEACIVHCADEKRL